VIFKGKIDLSSWPELAQLHFLLVCPRSSISGRPYFGTNLGANSSGLEFSVMRALDGNFLVHPWYYVQLR